MLSCILSFKNAYNVNIYNALLRLMATDTMDSLLNKIYNIVYYKLSYIMITTFTLYIGKQRNLYVQYYNLRKIIVE